MSFHDKPQETRRAYSRRQLLGRLLTWGAGSLGLLAVTACRPIQGAPGSLSATATQTPEPPTLTPTTIPTARPTPTGEPVAAVTPTPSVTVTPTATPTATATATIEIQLFRFQTERLDIAPGTTVTWINRDDIVHSVTSGVPDAADGRFDSGLFPLGEQFSHTFSDPGEYPYFCTRHPHMVGTIVVTA